MSLQNVQQLLQKKLTRKEFLQVVGLGILSMVGISHFLQGMDKALDSKTAQYPTDYSESSYGG